MQCLLVARIRGKKEEEVLGVLMPTLAWVVALRRGVPRDGRRSGAVAMVSGGARRSERRRAVALRAVGAEERRRGAIYRRRSRARPVAAWRDACGGQLVAVRASTAS